MDNSAFDMMTEHNITDLTHTGMRETSFDRSDDFPPPPPNLDNQNPLSESESSSYCQPQSNRLSTGSSLSYNQYEELPANLYKLNEEQRRHGTSSTALAEETALRRKNSSPTHPAPHPPSINNSTLSRKLPSSPAMSTFQPTSPENTLNGGHRRLNPLYDYNESKDSYADTYMYPTQSELNRSVSTFNKSTDSDGDSKKSDRIMSVPTGISLIALFVSVAALVLALLITLGVLQLNNQPVNEVIRLTPQTSAIISPSDNNDTAIKINEMMVLMELLKIKTDNQSDVISQLLTQVDNLKTENNQLKIQLNETAEDTFASIYMLNSNLSQLINQSDLMDDKLGQSLHSLDRSLKQSEIYFLEELSSLNQSLILAVENVTARLGEPGLQGATGGIDPSLCQHEQAIKYYGGPATNISTHWVYDAENLKIISASCSYENYTSALLTTENENAKRYRCNCFGGSENDESPRWTRICQLDYWQCPRHS